MDSNGLLHKLLECAMQFNPSFRVCRERFTYEEAFSGEIGRLVSSLKVVLLFWHPPIPQNCN